MLKLPEPDDDTDDDINDDLGEKCRSSACCVFMWYLFLLTILLPLGIILMALEKSRDGRRAGFILTFIAVGLGLYLLVTSRLRVPYDIFVIWVKRLAQVLPVVDVCCVIFVILVVVSLAFYLY